MKMRTVRLVLLMMSVLLLGVPLQVQGQMKMTTTVLPDRVLIGAEYIPRRLDLPNKLIVPAGQTVELPDGTFDYIEVAGTLRASRSKNTQVSVTTLVVLPMAVLDFGTRADPLPCSINLTVTIRNVPIDTTIDPYQWGNGLVNFGAQNRVGCTKTGWGVSNRDLLAGATSVTLISAPVGWAVGDELLFPDTAQPHLAPNGASLIPSRRESPVTIAAINGATITLSKPLDFSHFDQVAPDGNVVLHPRVANLTRNIVIRSENPAGTRGHLVNISHDSSVDIEYSRAEHMGRTLPVPLDNTTASNGNITHVGTNQVGKYGGDHFHHVDSLTSGLYQGNVVIGADGEGKWGIVVHSTSDMTVAENVCVGFPGACLITEDGNEVRNVFRHNLLTYSASTNPVYGTLANPNDSVEKNDQLSNAPGSGGNGIWAKGVQNSFIDNEAWNNARGITLFNQDFPPGIKYPGAPGADPDTPANAFIATPIAFTGNVAASNPFDGLEHWSTNPFPMVGTVLSFNGMFQASFPISNGNHPNFVDSTVLGDRGSTICLETSNAYSPDFTTSGGYFGGCAIGVRGIGHGFLSGTTMQNVINILWSGSNDTPFEGRLDGVIFKAMPGQPRRDIVFGLTPPWPGPPAPLPVVGVTPFRWQQGSRFTMKNYQGHAGEDYRLISPEQIATNAAWPSYGPNPEGSYEWNCPAINLTMAQCWSTYGLGIYGEVVDASLLAPLPGLFTWNPKTAPPVSNDGQLSGTLVPYNVATTGLSPVFGPPRAIMTWPRSDVQAYVASDNTVPMYFANTGDMSQSDTTMLISFDGANANGTSPQGDSDLVLFSIPAVNGLHHVDTWRRNKQGVRIDSSKMSFTFTVGSVVPTTGTVPNVVGQTQLQATSAIVAAGFTVPTPITATDSIVPVGIVLSQVPVAGSTATLGSAVALVVSSGPPVPPPDVWTTIQQLGPVFWQKLGAQNKFRECIVDDTHCMVFP